MEGTIEKHKKVPREWLSRVLRVNVSDLLRLTDSLHILVLTVAWAYVEQQLGDRSWSDKKCLDVAQSLSPSTIPDYVEEAFGYFRHRYGCDEEKKRQLVGPCGRSWNVFDATLRKRVDSINNIDKAAFLFYVSYRFRNNMFHGNKRVQRWKDYADQVCRCSSFLVFALESSLPTSQSV